MSKMFTVIVLSYNNYTYLKQCLDSILIQKYESIEIIVADDGSCVFDRDEIVTYIENNKHNNIVNYIVYQNEKNVGTVRSANRAIKNSKGSYIKLLAADDALYDENSLSNAEKALRDSNFGIITSDVMKCDENLNPISKYQKKFLKRMNGLSSDEEFRWLCIHNDIIAGGVFFARHFFDKYGLFDESFVLLEDWPTWLNATKLGCKICFEPFYAIRYRSNNGIGTSINSIYLKDKKKVLKNIIIPSKHKIGLFWYLVSRMSFILINLKVIRKLYGIVYRKNDKKEVNQ